ncbi:MAG: Type 1 glutamine amidotransferase-like domain-containing protein [Mycobacteriales bacterium]
MASDGKRHVYACGGFLPLRGMPPIISAMLAQTGTSKPRLCLLPTADETDLSWVQAAEQAFDASPITVSHLRLFPMPSADPTELLLAADAVFVGGGSTANMLALWQVHGIDVLLRRAWDAGVVLGGVSAGATCWFEGGVTDSFGPQLAPLRDGLGLLGGSYCSHYNRELRRPSFHEAVTSGLLPAGLACDDGAAAHFVDTDLAQVLTETAEARAWRVSSDAEGQIIELPLATHLISG